jgi:hypothetical protein
MLISLALILRPIDPFDKLKALRLSKGRPRVVRKIEPPCSGSY